jgi:endonuclease YncB( thermonuclease family)
MIGRFLIRRFARQFRRTAVLLVALAIAAAFNGEPDAQAQQSGALEARVSKILNGDTFTLSGESRRIRVWGLDAPEWDHRGGSVATATLKGLISSKTLRCTIRDIDRYGRLVGQCFLPDGRDIAAEMIRSGAASEYCRYSRGYYGTC